MSTSIKIIVEDRAGRVRVLVAGELVSGVLEGRPTLITAGETLGLIVQMDGPRKLRLYGRGRVLDVNGRQDGEAAALKPGLRLTLDVPALMPAATGRTPWDDGVADTVKYPESEFWEGDTSKIPRASSSKPKSAPASRFSSLELADAVSDGRDGPWTDSSSTGLV